MSKQVEKRARLYDGDVFEYEGHKFRVEIARDDDMQEPWKEHDGHGVISEWTSRGKYAGEKVLASDRGTSFRYYNIQETMAIAKQDGWGASEKGQEQLAAKLGRKPTKGELTALAVDEDFERMKAWCDDEWYWVYVRVVLLKEDPDARGGFFETVFDTSLGGIDGSDQEDYLTDMAYELAGEVLAERGEQ